MGNEKPVGGTATSRSLTQSVVACPGCTKKAPASASYGGAPAEAFLGQPAAPRLRGVPVAPPENPCSLLGMTGSPQAMTAFNADVDKLSARWGSSSVAERSGALESAINTALASQGVPPVRVRPTTRKNAAGEFKPWSWEVHVARATLESPTLSDDQLSALKATVFHEARHAEQDYLVARKTAGEYRTSYALPPAGAVGGASGTPSQDVDASALSKKLSFPPSVTAKALDAPLSPGSPECACAEWLARSTVGAGQADRVATLQALKSRRADADAADERLAKSKNDPALQRAARETAGGYEEAQRAYEWLPEELDAREAAYGLMERGVRDRSHGPR